MLENGEKLITSFRGKKRTFTKVAVKDLVEGDSVLWDNQGDPELISGEREVETAEITEIKLLSGFVYICGDNWRGGKRNTVSLSPRGADEKLWKEVASVSARA